MHVEILVEDESGKMALESLVPKILAPAGDHTHRIKSYKGIGRLPRNLRTTQDPSRRALLNQLPRILRGYGKSLLPREQHAVMVVVDCDERDCRELKRELIGVLNSCSPAPRTRFRIAIEELEAWFLGDRRAIKTAFDEGVLRGLRDYTQDSVCGTWELLADAIHPGGSQAMKKQGYPMIGQIKCEWAERIAPEMDVNRNASPSFQAFRDGLLALAEGAD